MAPLHFSFIRAWHWTEIRTVRVFYFFGILAIIAARLFTCGAVRMPDGRGGFEYADAHVPGSRLHRRCPFREQRRNFKSGIVDSSPVRILSNTRDLSHGPAG